MSDYSPRRRCADSFVPLSAMNASHYQLQTTLAHHRDSITHLQFSLNGQYLASGSDDGVILIYNTASWEPIRLLIDASPVRVLLWHNKARHILLCGYRSGDLHIVDVGKPTVR
jgi:WD40 repeat protein